MKIFKLLPLVAVLFIIQSVNADDLTLIEVESSILSNSITENRYPISVIDGKDIDSSQSIGTNLRSIPGVSNSDYGTSVGQPVIRGLGGSRVRVLSNNNYVSDLSFQRRSSCYAESKPCIAHRDYKRPIIIIQSQRNFWWYSQCNHRLIY